MNAVKRCISFVMVLALILGMVAVAQAGDSVNRPRRVFDKTLDAMVLVDETISAPAPVPEPCEHAYRIMRKPLQTESICITETAHEKRVCFLAICDQCGDCLTIFRSDGMEEHTMAAAGDVHAAEGNLHTYCRRCTQCGFEEHITVGCPGTASGDCPSPFTAGE